MPGIIINISFNDGDLGRKLLQMTEQIRHPQPLLRQWGMQVLSSVHRNFQEEGRPVRWKPSLRALEQHGKTLQDTGRLKNSITTRVENDYVEIGTNVEYASIHQHGGNKILGKRIVTIPARPFLMVQDEDREIMLMIGERYLRQISGQ